MQTLQQRPGNMGREDDRVDDRGLIYSSRIRLARNLRGRPFPDWAAPEERASLLARVSGVLQASQPLRGATLRTMGSVGDLERTVLLERRLISPALAAGDATAAVLYTQDGQLSVMVNEEDHLRLQAVLPGAGLATVWDRLQALHAALEQHLAFAFSDRYGYVTACPSNTGTGMRASVMLHLAGLQVLGEMDAVARGLQRMGYAVRGAYGEGSAASGALYQISNQKTLGWSEEETIRNVDRTVGIVLNTERAARKRLWEAGRRLAVEDAIGRAYGQLRYAKLLSAGEAMDRLSALLLGIECGAIRGIPRDRVRTLMYDIQPGHLQVRSGTSLSAAERDAFRSRYLRQELATMELI